jgi:hypothetical protein
MVAIVPFISAFDFELLSKEKKKLFCFDSNEIKVLFNSFTIPIVLMLFLLSTDTKSKGLMITPGFKTVQKESVVLENFSDMKVKPILVLLVFPNNLF